MTQSDKVQSNNPKKILKNLSGLDKVSALFQMLDIEEIIPILHFLDRSEVERISKNMSSPNAFTEKNIVSAITEFRKHSKGVFSKGSPEVKAQDFLQEFENMQVESTPGAKKRTNLSGLKELESLDAEKIFEIFKENNKQLISVILSRLPALKSKNVLELFEKEERAQILNRIAMLGNVDFNVLEGINNALKEKLKKEKQNAESNRALSVANILSILPEEESTDFLNKLKEKNEVLFESINKFYMPFSYIISLENETLQQILASVEPKMLAQAICKSEQEVKDKMFSVITKRAVTLVEDELQSAQKVKQGDIQSAQQSIINVARNLEADGKIDLGKE